VVPASPSPEAPAAAGLDSGSAASADRSHEMPAPAPPAVRATPEDAPTSPPGAPADVPGTLAIEFEHHLRHGTLEVWVDGTPVLDEAFDGRVTRKILTFEARRGLVQQQLTLAAGKHEVRVQVRWDDNVKAARISGTFKPGTTRHLDVKLRRDLSLGWK
jgi:hypothetical protein